MKQNYLWKRRNESKSEVVFIEIDMIFYPRIEKVYFLYQKAEQKFGRQESYQCPKYWKGYGKSICSRLNWFWINEGKNWTDINLNKEIKINIQWTIILLQSLNNFFFYIKVAKCQHSCFWQWSTSSLKQDRGLRWSFGWKW